MGTKQRERRPLAAHLHQAIGGRSMPPCRGLKWVDGECFAYYLDKEQKVAAMPLAEFLARSGAKVRA